MKSSTSCRVCRRWLEGDWNRERMRQRAAGGSDQDALDAARRQADLDAIQRQMDQGHCDGCIPFTGPRVWPMRSDMERDTTGYTKAPFAITTDRPSLIGYRDFAVLIWASRRGVTVAGEATARWWSGDGMTHVRVDGRITSPLCAQGAVTAHAFGLEAAVAEIKDGTHASWSVSLPRVVYRRRKGGRGIGDVQATIVLAHLGRPAVDSADTLRINIVPGSLRIGPIPR